MSLSESPLLDKTAVEATISALETTGRAIDNWVLIFAAGVAFCLAVEVVFSVAHWLNERKLRPLRVTLSEINSREIEQLRNENLSLQQRIAPRRISLEHQRSMVEALKSFSGKTVRITAYPLDMEGSVFGAQIAAVLRGAGINVVDQYVGGVVNPMPVPFIFGAKITGRDNLLRRALFGVLGVQSTLDLNDPGESDVDATIFVGVKPIMPPGGTIQVVPPVEPPVRQ